MTAFVLEFLFSTGWRRAGEIHWRLSDAVREANRALKEHDARGARILSVRINPDAIVEMMSEPNEEPSYA